MRGKEKQKRNLIWFTRITPAHAGKSQDFACQHHKIQDHPRTCGEKNTGVPKGFPDLGSPPHMRGKVAPNTSNTHLIRITPAHAGKR